MARMASLSSRSAMTTAAFIASVLDTIMAALRRLVSPRASASAMARPDAVRFSMLELAADSDRSSTAEKGTISSPTSKRAISLLASSASGRDCGRQDDSQVSDGVGDRGLVLAGLTLGRT